VAWEYVTIEKRGRVSIVRFDRGDGRNAMSTQLIAELTEAAHSFDDDLETSAIVVTGSDQVFSMGYDLKEPLPENMGMGEQRKRNQMGPKLCKAWEELEPLTICAIEGWCIGGGVAFAVPFDLRVAGKSATLFAPEIERGMNMSWQSVPRTVNLIGPSRTKRMFALAERVTAQTAERWGLVDGVTEDGGALAGALRFAERAAELPPTPLRMIKQGVNGAANATSNAASFMDADQNLLNRFSEDFVEGVQSFLDKRPPKYTGR
jgi:enoyl-CoA hydratase